MANSIPRRGDIDEIDGRTGAAIPLSFSLKQIRHFLAAAETGQISRAAVEHNISQSALTASIHGLEALLGSPLFERRPNGVALTHAGTRFLPLARKVAAACNEALAVTSEFPRKVQGRLTLAVTYTIAGYFLTPLLTRFRRIFPQVELAVHEAPRLAIEAGLGRGEPEVALLLTSNITPGADLQCRTLFRSTRRLWTPSEHPLLRQESVGLAEIAAYPYIALTVDEALDTRHPLLGGHAAPAQHPVPHRLGRGRALHGRGRSRRHGPVRHGLPPLVARSPAHRDP